MARGDSPWFRNTKCTSGCPACACSNTGISRRHGGHQLAHRFTTAGLPRKAASEAGAPCRSLRTSSASAGCDCGAGGAISASAQPDQAGHGQRRQREAPWRAPAQDRRQGIGPGGRQPDQAVPAAVAQVQHGQRFRQIGVAVLPEIAQPCGEQAPEQRIPQGIAGAGGFGGGCVAPTRRRRASSAQASRPSAADSSSTPSSIGKTRGRDGSRAS